jgi:hypothetical protein
MPSVKVAARGRRRPSWARIEIIQGRGGRWAEGEGGLSTRGPDKASLPKMELEGFPGRGIARQSRGTDVHAPTGTSGRHESR